ncbi:DUF6415 family natural product biosynthesis protein [Streptomyces graminilatus]|uniref:DUF6415 family natural product biosynthesis protein n=1 Tax=Streptomyces graminilatus TaxID=1464070 RepID=UPI000AAEDA74|nr:DUF6415 family natural product biosynthesis protein [Streptomyces graminilatus]
MTANTALPLDIETMRASARRLLAPADAVVPSMQELETLTLLLKGHMALIIPELGRAASSRCGDDTLKRADARVSISETCRKLRIEPSPALSAQLGYARRLSRCLNVLCDHYEELCGAVRPRGERHAPSVSNGGGG